MVKGAEAIGMSPKKICGLFGYSLWSFYRIKNDLLNPEPKEKWGGNMISLKYS
jgi:hypothetical protein